MEEKFTFFWDGPFSQWHSCTFTIDGIEYNCAEQWMMAGKARLFNDDETLQMILEADLPSYQKKLGRQVKGYTDEKWDVVARNVVYLGNYAKFGQNAHLMEKLLATDGTTLVEASPYDKKWGIGLRESDPRAKDRKTWQGTNWLGEVLTVLREDFIKGAVDQKRFLD